ncbi:hypothetical protein NJB1604_51160 [Mycobacterium marinum]|nr:hypothetical protein NJB1604_51160 [Mycobacterium marinum]
MAYSDTKFSVPASEEGGDRVAHEFLFQESDSHWMNSYAMFNGDDVAD